MGVFASEGKELFSRLLYQKVNESVYLPACSSIHIFFFEPCSFFIITFSSALIFDLVTELLFVQDIIALLCFHFMR